MKEKKVVVLAGLDALGHAGQETLVPSLVVGERDEEKSSGPEHPGCLFENHFGVIAMVEHFLQKHGINLFSLEGQLFGLASQKLEAFAALDVFGKESLGGFDAGIGGEAIFHIALKIGVRTAHIQEIDFAS